MTGLAFIGKWGETMCTKLQALDILSAVYQNCNQIYAGRIQDAILYGSYARGDNKETSDIDILLTADLTQEEISAEWKTLAALSGRLGLENDTVVSIQVVPLAQFRRYADFLPFYQNVLREGIRYAS